MSLRALPLLVALAIACAAALKPVSEPAPSPPKEPAPLAENLQEERDTAADVLTREFPQWASRPGAAPERVIGLLLPSASRWGRTLGPDNLNQILNPHSYGSDPGAAPTYELRAKDLRPQTITFALSDKGGIGFRRDLVVQTPDGRLEVMAGAKLAPGDDNPFGLKADAHLAEVQQRTLSGPALGFEPEMIATAVRVLDATPGYPRDVTRLLDAAQATFQRFVADQAASMAKAIDQSVAKDTRLPKGLSRRELVSEAFFPYWDDERRRLVLLFYRRVIRTTEYSIACERTYEGMPPEPSSMTIRHSHGAELALKLELDAAGLVVAWRSFAPATIAPQSNLPPQTEEMRGYQLCHGSPGLHPRDRMLPTPLDLPGLPEGVWQPPVCGNGKREDAPCDAADLGDQTCERLGFAGGHLRCTHACAFDTTRCQMTVSSGPDRISARVIDGDVGAIAVSRGKAALVATRGPTLNVRFLDAPTLKPDGQPIAWSLPKKIGHTITGPLIEAVPGGFLIAAIGYANSLQTVVLHVAVDGTIAGPISTIPGRAVFLTAGTEHVLLGVVDERLGVQLDTVRLDHSGRLVGEPVASIFAQPGGSYPVAAAAFTGSGWVVASGMQGALRYVQVGLDGAIQSGHEIDAPPGQVRVARGESSTFLVYTGANALFATELPETGPPTAPRAVALGRFATVVAARTSGPTLVAWASDTTGMLYRCELDLRTGKPRQRTVITAPVYAPSGSADVDGVFFHLFHRSPGRDEHLDHALWLYRGP